MLEEDVDNGTTVGKRSRLLLKYIQLLYQDVFGHVKEFWDGQATDE
jgi:hypothetical protein